MTESIFQQLAEGRKTPCLDLRGATWNNTRLPGGEETSKSTTLIDFFFFAVIY